MILQEVINLRKYKEKVHSVGVTKEFDNLWRLVIPKEMRELYKFNKEVELVNTPDGVLIRNPEYRLVRIVKKHSQK